MTSNKISTPYYIYIGILFFLFHTPFTLFSQVENMETSNKLPFKERLFYGGGFGLQFGNTTLIDVSPLIGYKITQKLGVGLNFSYKYYRLKNFYGNDIPLIINVAGGSLFARYLILENIFAHAEYEKLIYRTKTLTSGADIQAYTSILVGAGYRQMMSERASMNLMILWNLNDTPDSPYTNPIIRMGFSVGF